MLVMPRSVTDSSVERIVRRQLANSTFPFRSSSRQVQNDLRKAVGSAAVQAAEELIREMDVPKRIRRCDVVQFKNGLQNTLNIRFGVAV